MKKLMILFLLLSSACSYRMVLPPKFKKGDCIMGPERRYIFLILESKWGEYRTCQTSPNIKLWYACDNRDKGIFQDLIDEDYKKVTCPNLPFAKDQFSF